MKTLKQIFKEIGTSFGFERLHYKLRAQCGIDVSLSQLYRYSEEGATSELPPTLYIPITNITGNDAILRYYAEHCNRIIIELPSCNIKSAKHITREISKTLTECAEVVESSSKAILDGKLTENEKEEIIKEISEAQVQLARLGEVIRNG